jgi:hypothetical protein
MQNYIMGFLDQLAQIGIFYIFTTNFWENFVHQKSIGPIGPAP